MATPTYIVTPLAGAHPAVRIETQAPDSPFCDECEPVVLQACSHEAFSLMQVFLAGLSFNTSWTRRESRGTAFIMESMLPDGVTELSLNHATNSRRPAPTAWYCILTGGEDKLLELSMLNETLAHQVFDALAAGTLELRFADPDPVQP